MDALTAEYKIAEILRDLERDSGRIVEAISIRDVEITNIGSARPELLRRVCIELIALPGSNWSVRPK